MSSNETTAARPRKSIRKVIGAATAAVGVAFALARPCAPSVANELATPTDLPRKALFALGSSVPKQPQAPRPLRSAQ